MAVMLPLMAVAPARGSFPGTNGGFALIEVVGGQASLVMTSRTGVTVHRLARCQFDPQVQSSCLSTPDWSPSGTWVTYVRTVSGADRVVIVRANGTDRRTLRHDGHSWYPVWSPDGRRIAFVNAESGYLATMRRDGTHVQRVLKLSDVLWTGDIFGLDWSSGNRLVITGWNGVLDVRPDGSDLRQLASTTSGHRTPVAPDWDPSGRWLVYYRTVTYSGSDDLKPYGDISLLQAGNPDANDIGVGGADPCWSPDGSLIAYIGGGALYTVAPDGTGNTVVAGTTGSVRAVDWRPR
jgi:Tol biopolymer transport system component